MLHAYIQKFDVMRTVKFFLGTKHGLRTNLIHVNRKQSEYLVTPQEGGLVEQKRNKML